MQHIRSILFVQTVINAIDYNAFTLTTGKNINPIDSKKCN